MSTDVRIDPEVSTITVDGASVEVLSLLLGGVPRGAAVVLAGPDGLDGIGAVETMNSLAQHGYESVLVSDDGDVAVVDALVALLAERDWEDEQIGLIGYGQGARTVLEAAAGRAYGAAVSIPREPRQLLVPEPITALRTAWLGMVGQGEHRGLPSALAAYRDDLEDRAHEYTRIVGYPGAEHALRDSTRPREHAAAFDAWQRTAEWLNKRVAPRPTPFAQIWRERQRSHQPTS
ncbi:dienelactone hydrolase family protein [Janibacter limosus]|uniref:dienelactone hydrolase family protein n=1 Tax=Janibacter limosus TaxID=53458 RepID=UPI00083398CD|nr:dienelactone hydrolase family protein [Janibacter limosus]